MRSFSLLILLYPIILIGQINSFYNIPETNITEKNKIFLDLFPDHALCKPKNLSVIVRSQEVSHLITWNEYKEFLSFCKKFKGESFYKQMLPGLPENVLYKGLNSTEFDSLPVVGVSWTNASHYCNWRTVYDNKSQIEFIYKLPDIIDIISLITNIEPSKSDFGVNYSEWTRTNKDESVPCRFYNYPSKLEDPPSLKRRRVIGKSFKSKYESLSLYNNSYYQDSSYSHVGFRIVKKQETNKNIRLYNTWINANPELFQTLLKPSKEHKIVHDKTKIIFNTLNGRFHGNYSSFHPNGNKKSEGQFYLNNRIGTWKYYDKKGKVFLIRKYLSNDSYYQEYPIPGDSQIQMILESEIYHPKRLYPGYNEWSYIQERQVYWSQRQWCNVDIENNPYLKSFLRVILSEKAKDVNFITYGAPSTKQDSLVLYSTNTDYFQTMIPGNKLDSILPKQYKFVKLLIKKDLWYDINENRMNQRIIGICPIVIDQTTDSNKEKALFWLYYPNIRRILAKWKIEFEEPKGKRVFETETIYSYSMEDVLYNLDYDWTIQRKNQFSSSTTDENISERKWENRILEIEIEHDLLQKHFQIIDK